ncbi:MAG: ribosomal-processing cysteine protease Prp [Chloroflexota bacterium]
MITVKVRRTEGRVASFEASGHAGSAQYGRDIVCAAVSAVTLTAVEGLRKVAGLAPRVVQNDDAGFLSVDLGRDATDASAQIILATMLTGLTAIAHDNPRYVKIEDID